MFKLFLTAFGVVAVSAIVLSPSSNILADDEPKVRSSKEKITRRKTKCKSTNKFKVTEDVEAKGRNFEYPSNVDIYVTENKKWGNTRQPIGPDVSTDNAETVPIDEDGKFPCTVIALGNTLAKGKYDIVVDANQDGTYDPADGDTIDGRSRNAGFKVR
jgi:hypothetical protein